VRVAIVNDIKLAVEALRRALRLAPDVELAWVAENGAEAVERCRRDLPDVVLMDLLMPVMDGVEATRRIMRDSPCAILVVTSTVEGHAAKVFQAMGAGALDAVPTPAMGPGGQIAGADPLLEKIARIGKLRGARPDALAPAAPPATPHATDTASGARPPLVAIGASTGGPPALRDVLVGLGDRSPLALVIVQHLDARFAPGLAEWLSGLPGSMPVVPAAEGMRPAAGQALLASTNDHLVLRPGLDLAYDPEPRDYPYRPSVDVFFRSLLRHWPAPGAAVLLTGMGRDGAEGLLELKQAGWLTFAQDRASSILYGMPKAAAELNAAVHVLSPSDVARRLASWRPAPSTPPTRNTP
jgi:two-component system, chemotaxis family, response regulator WspF